MVKTRRDKVDINKKSNKNGGLNILNQNIIYLQNSLASKIFEVEHLLNFTCKEIKTDYSLKFGVYEYKVDDYELKIRKTQRTIDLIKKEIAKQDSKSSNMTENQMKINQTKINKPKIDMKAIEKHIDNEFSQEDLALEEKIARVTIILDNYKKEQNAPKPYVDINHYYKECIKKAHPDVLFESEQHIEDLFFNAKEAYEDKDVESLKSTLYLIDAYRKKHPEDLSSKDPQELEKYKDILKIRIDLVEKEISEITNSKPYTLQDFLNNPKKVNSYKEELVRTLLNNEKEYVSYNDDLNTLKRENNLTYKLDLRKNKTDS